MKILKCVLTVFCAIGFFSIPLLAQKTDMEKMADAAISRGDYEEAVNQLEAYKAYLMTEGVKENSPEILRLSKTIMQAGSCRTAIADANRSYASLKSAASEYMVKVRSLNLHTSDGTQFSDVRKRYQRINALSKSVKGQYSAISAAFPTDTYSSGRVQSATDIYGKLDSPESVLESLFIEEASEQAMNNYLAILKPDASTAQKIRSDYAAWYNCNKARTLASCDYYLRSDFSLFKKNVEELRIAVVDEQNHRKDEENWRAVDRTSKQSILAYLKADTGNVKQYANLAKEIYAVLEAREAAQAEAREEWERVNKNDKYELRAYLKAHPNSGFSDEINNRLEGIAWEETDKCSIESLRLFKSNWPKSSHCEEVDAYLCLIGGRYKLSVSKYREAYSLYIKAAEVLTLSAEDSQNFIRLKEIETKRIEEEKEMNLFSRWNSTRTMDNAQAYTSEYPVGKYTDTVRDWIRSEEKRLRQEQEYREKCSKMECRMGISYSFERYSEAHQNASYEGYYKFLKEYRRSEFGSGFQITAGAGAMLYSWGKEDSANAIGSAFGGVVGIKIGRNDVPINFQAGCEFNYLITRFKIEDETFTGSGWDYSPYALLRFNMPGKGHYVHFSVGGGYGFTTNIGYGQVSLGWSPKKWFDLDFYIKAGYPNQELYTCYGVQLLFNIF